MDYGFTNSDYTTSVATGAVAGTVTAVIIVYAIIMLAITAFSIVALWKIFKKAGKEGWIALVPFYNLYTLFEITWGNGWLFLLIFLSIIPIVGAIAVFVILIITDVKLAKVFGKSGGFAVGLVFLSVIFMGILAFDKSEYVGIEGKTPATPNPVPDSGFAPQPAEPVQSAEPAETVEPAEPAETEQSIETDNQ